MLGFTFIQKVKLRKGVSPPPSQGFTKEWLCKMEQANTNENGIKRKVHSLKLNGNVKQNSTGQSKS